MKLSLPLSLACFALLAVSVPGAEAADAATGYKFDFGAGSLKPGFTRVAPSTAYASTPGYGFENSPTLSASPGGVSSDSPFAFSVKLPEGNYDVTAVLGDGKSASTVTIKAEARRLMVEQIAVPAGRFQNGVFTVNIRGPRINDHEQVKLTSRELGPPLALRWDDKLTLEFDGTHPSLSALEIVRADSALTVFLAGDSTTTEQASEPWAGWGQMLSRSFRPGVAIANHAESGLALDSFQGQKRLAKILSAMKRGDYLFIQFGHNDQKEKGEGVGPFTTYKQRLADFVRAARNAGGNPVLVTPMERRRFDPQGQPEPTLADYAEAARQVGAEEKVPVIDLNAMSLKLYAALGAEGSKKAFVQYPAGTFPGQDKPLKDDTHHNGYGAYELAKCIVEGIKAQVPALAKYLATDLHPFDPAHPDPFEKYDVPASPNAAVEKPAGS